MTVLFWISALIVGYVYVGYPCLLAVWARVADRRPRPVPFQDGRWPSISIVIAARNEAHRLPARITEPPRAGLSRSDARSSSSPTGPRTRRARHWRRSAHAVRLIEVPAGGKPLALNAGVAAATGEILVFADARQRFAPGALAALVSNFSDPSVGGATGELVLDCEHQDADTSVGEGIGLYWRYEKWLRRNESRVWSTLGATGAIYALRRELLDAASRRHAAGRRARADAGGARRLPHRLRGARDRLRPRVGRCRGRVAPQDPDAGGQLSDSRAGTAAAGAVRQPGVAAVRLAQDRTAGRPLGAARRCSSPACRSRAATSSTRVPLAAQGVFYGLAIAGALFQARERFARIAFTFVMMNLSAVAGLAALRRGREVWR